MVRLSLARFSARKFSALLTVILLLMLAELFVADRGLRRTSEVTSGLRLAVWVIGLIAIALIGVAVVRARAQAIRLTERSAELERLYSEVARANTAKSEPVTPLVCGLQVVPFQARIAPSPSHEIA